MSRTRLVSIFGSLLMVFAGVLTASAQEGRVVRPQYGGFSLEVLVGGSPLDVLYGRGRRYVEAWEGAEYDLLLRNPLPVRVAVALSVDGVNTAVFFSENVPRTYTAVPPPYYEPAQPRERSDAREEGERRAQNEAPKSRGSAGATAARPRADDEHAATGIGRSVGHD